MGDIVMLGIIVVLVPAILACIAVHLKKHPVEKIGSNGFSVPEATKSEARWKYAQEVGPGFLLKTALIALLVNLAVVGLCYVLKTGTQGCAYILAGWATGIVVAAMVILNWKVGKHFQGQGDHL